MLVNRIGLVIGATGLTGKNLVQQLLQSQYFSGIVVFVRRATSLKHPKLTEHIVNFDQPEEWKGLVKGDVLFSCLGTTLQQAGSKEGQFKVDYTYQLEFAKTAAEHGVDDYVLLSSTGADASSRIFYTRIKGELEDQIKRLPYKKTIILKPGALDGERQKVRKLEQSGIHLLKFLNKIGIAKKYQPIQASLVAKAMLNAVIESPQGISVYELREIFDLADNS